MHEHVDADIRAKARNLESVFVTISRLDGITRDFLGDLGVVLARLHVMIVVADADVTCDVPGFLRGVGLLFFVYLLGEQVSDIVVLVDGAALDSGNFGIGGKCHGDGTEVLVVVGLVVRDAFKAFLA